jgi:hypothetical protein
MKLSGIIMLLIGAAVGFALCWFLKPDPDPKENPFDLGFELPSTQELAEKQTFESFLQNDYNKMLKNNQQMDSMWGDFISLQRAKENKDRYEIWRDDRQRSTVVTMPYYNFIGKVKMRQLIQLARMHHQNASSDEEKIAGFLIHMGIRKVDQTDSNGNNIKGFLLDPFLTPVQLNGQPVYGPGTLSQAQLRQLGDEAFNGNSTLDRSLPCPTECPDQ